tara:strand:- start:143 stop:304 length:162 start_codon:yes stop_codon:yes gene_type:complete
MYKCENPIWEKAHSLPNMDWNLKKLMVIVLIIYSKMAYSIQSIFFIKNIVKKN